MDCNGSVNLYMVRISIGLKWQLRLVELYLKSVDTGVTVDLITWGSGTSLIGIHSFITGLLYMQFELNILVIVKSA